MERRFANHPVVRRWAAFAFAGLAAFSGVLTYLVMTGAVPVIPPTVQNVVTLLVIDLVLLVLLAAVVGYRVAALWRERRRRRGGSQLHVRLAVLFTVVAIVPTVLVALFTVLFFHYGLQGWFSQRVQSALERSLVVAQAYLEEHQRVLIADALAMANDLGRGGPQLSPNTRRVDYDRAALASAGALSPAQGRQGGGRVLARSMFSFGAIFSPVPEWALEAARRGEVAIVEDPDGDRLGALVRIAGLNDTFLYIGRYVDPIVVSQVTRVRSAVAEYAAFEGRRTQIEYTFAMMFATVAALFIFAAIWVGFNLAAQLAEPVMNLISAADRVRGGDLTARVPVDARERGEIDALGRAFNRMAGQLDRQRTALIDANLELDERRRFTEAVLAGVAVGVVGLDAERRVHLPNRVASDLLGVDLTEHLECPIAEIVPEFGAVLESASRRPDRIVEAEAAIERDRETRTFQLRATAETSPEGLGGFVLTFADITDLQSAQRTAAWSDVARRIAHEIKNPLTPIQLAAERLGRRYAKQIEDDPETFALCIDIIVRQVDDMRRMVNEFASFARMPAPVLAEADLADVVRRAVFLQREAARGIDIELRLPDRPVMQVCDPQLLGQAVTNLLLNAAQALGNGGGRITAALAELPERAEISIEDNGPGFPPDLRHRLTEPYVTSKDRRGAGLGLAIVQKIVEDQNAALHLEDGEAGGARVRIVFGRGETAMEPERGRLHDA
ncbi:MAG: HAMP domain-containing protein [Alphaproteobacteria bacterium]|nr:HAMP domain-containing protein [Alphaproteobacteria bacterium]